MKMGMGRLREFSPFVKEALHKTAQAANFFCFLHVANTYICSFAGLVGPSMLPTFTTGNLVMTERISSRLGKIGLGDVVLVRSPENPRKVVAKRIKGVEGDVVSYRLGLEQNDEQKTVVVPKGHVWVEGDNKANSYDSRQFGPVPYALIHARIFIVVWPPKDFRLISKEVP